MRLSREEIFGPILPILTYDDIDTVIAEINARDKPLSLYIFDRDAARVDGDHPPHHLGRGRGQPDARPIFSHLNLPFGGVNTSGIGAAHGHAGFPRLQP